ncbi:MAG: alpha-ribazole phosphatase [Nitrospinae bacterium]|nr:alpha-ribazole phosphatase [Nitrospinota bacterium]
MGNSFTGLYLIRHGEVANVEEGVYNGHFDVDLSDKGIRQMEEMAERLSKKEIRAIYCSDLKRTVGGAKIIGKRLSLSQIKSFKDLRELNYGRWEGLRFEEIKRRYPEEVEARNADYINYRIKGGENFIEMSDRVIPRIEEILRSHRGEDIALVAHGGVNRVILCWALNMDISNMLRIKQDFAAFNIINFYDSTAVVELMNG